MFQRDHLYVCQAKYGEPPVMKHDKQLKPASMRVKEAAEALLYVLMEQVSHGRPQDAVDSAEAREGMLQQDTFASVQDTLLFVYMVYGRDD